jgi:hypothetical protein
MNIEKKVASNQVITTIRGIYRRKAVFDERIAKMLQFFDQTYLAVEVPLKKPPGDGSACAEALADG